MASEQKPRETPSNARFGVAERPAGEEPRHEHALSTIPRTKKRKASELEEDEPETDHYIRRQAKARCLRDEVDLKPGSPLESPTSSAAFTAASSKGIEQQTTTQSAAHIEAFSSTISQIGISTMRSSAPLSGNDTVIASETTANFVSFEDMIFHDTDTDLPSEPNNETSDADSIFSHASETSHSDPPSPGPEPRLSVHDLLGSGVYGWYNLDDYGYVDLPSDVEDPDL
ncbi:uncharacterized protein BDV14DRAFT_184049 [Aspergillus stella-maris]|uniref:uncharacterized protein n=1 Tax=Aspergillus stella-maris TaxID=1810926 RepID=UPI003CCDAEC9